MSREERQARRELWHERIKEFRASGQSVAAWGQAQGLKEHQVRYWLRRLSPVAKADVGAATWLPVRIAEEEYQKAPTGVVVRVGDAAIEVSPGFNRALLADVVETLLGRC